MESCFELSKAADGQFRFALKGDNGKTLLASELYRSKDSAQAGIVSVQKNCGAKNYKPMQPVCLRGRPRRVAFLHFTRSKQSSSRRLFSF